MMTKISRERARKRSHSGARAAGIVAVALGAASAAPAATPPTALVMAWNIDVISTFDPAQIGEAVANEIFQNTCESLVDFDPADESKIVPRLARSWDVSDDGRQITFHLRKGLKHPSGNAATAGDLAWSMQRVVKLGLGNAATLNEYGFTKDNVDRMIVAPDDATLVMKLDRSYPLTLVLQGIGANRVAALLDRQTIMKNEVNGDLGNKYLATRTECVGPYRLARWNAGEAVILEANENYWGEKPALTRILIRHVAEAGTQRLLLEKGDVDLARDLTPEDLADLGKAAGITVAKVLKPQLLYWNVNNGDTIFSNEKVRLAIRYLVDYEGLAKTVMANIGVPRASFVQIGAVGALDEQEGQPFKLDLVKAKQLLREAGYPDGFEADLIIGTQSFTSPIAQSIQENAAKVGVQLKIERMANAQLFSRVRGREFQTSIQGWTAGVPDAHGNASRQIYNPDNRVEARATMYPSWRAAYYSEHANRKVEEALFEKDPAKRVQLYHSLQREMMEKGPHAYMFQLYNVAGVRESLKGWTWNGFRSYYDLASK